MQTFRVFAENLVTNQRIERNIRTADASTAIAIVQRSLDLLVWQVLDAIAA